MPIRFCHLIGMTFHPHYSEKTPKWSNGANSGINRVAQSINHTLTNRKNPNVIEAQLTEGFSQLGVYLGTQPIPYAAGLAQFLEANWNAKVGNARAQ